MIEDTFKHNDHVDTEGVSSVKSRMGHLSHNPSGI